MSAPVAGLKAPAGLQAVHRSELVYLSSTSSCGDLVATATALIMLRGWVRGRGRFPETPDKFRRILFLFFCGAAAAQLPTAVCSLCEHSLAGEDELGVRHRAASKSQRATERDRRVLVQKWDTASTRSVESRKCVEDDLLLSPGFRSFVLNNA
ncbi:unnamed protein product [Boreogadus saida]